MYINQPNPIDIEAIEEGKMSKLPTPVKDTTL
jgi:hypothetical protein